MDYNQKLPEACPPTSASSREQRAYRILKAAGATLDDLKSHAELGTAVTADPCRRCGVSIFATYRQAQHRLAVSPHLGTAVGFAILTPGHGAISPAHHQSGHMDWWPFEGMANPADFKVVQGEH